MARILVLIPAGENPSRYDIFVEGVVAVIIFVLFLYFHMKVTLKNYHDEKCRCYKKKKSSETERRTHRKKLKLHSVTTENRVTLPRRQIIHRAEIK